MTVAALLVAAPAAASPVAPWSGAGPNACNGRCTRTWAETLLTDAQRTQLHDAMQHQPFPETLWVEDGDYMPLMTYWRDGAPHAVHGGTVAVLDEPERAIGWRMSGWTFARLDACKNWAVISHSAASLGRIAPALFRSSGYLSDSPVASSPKGSASAAGDSGILPYLARGPSTDDGTAAPRETASLLFRSIVGELPSTNGESAFGLVSSRAGQAGSPSLRKTLRGSARPAASIRPDVETPLPVVSLPASAPALVFALAGLIYLQSRERKRRSR